MAITFSRKHGIPLVILLALVAVHPVINAQGSSIMQSAREAVLLLYPEGTRVAIQTIALSQRERDSLKKTHNITAPDTLRLLLPISKARVLGYALVDDVRGKDQPITYVLVADTVLTVRHVEILAYREPYGGEVRNSSWLRQFFGKTPSDQIRWGREVRNISGATISARSVTSGVRNMLTILSVLRNRLPQTVNE